MITIMHTTVIGGEVTNQKLTHVDREASVLEASKLMRKSGAVELLVTDETNGKLQPLGIVSASDIVKHVVAAGLDPAVLTAGDIAWPGMPTSETQANDADRLQHFRESKEEAMAVMDGDGRLVGTVRLEELIGKLSH